MLKTLRLVFGDTSRERDQNTHLRECLNKAIADNAKATQEFASEIRQTTLRLVVDCRKSPGKVAAQ